MRHLQNIKIKKRTMPEWLTLFVVIMPFLLSFLIDFVGVPSFIKYSIDVAWIILLVISVVRREIIVEDAQRTLLLLISSWLLYVGIVYIFNFQSPFYFLWGIRNNLRFYIAFLSFAAFLGEDDSTVVLKFFDCIFWVNVPVVFFQFFVLGFEQDYLGGVFGIEKGCNAYTSILFIIVISKSVLLYFEEKEATLKCLSKCALALIIAAISELKFFFLLFLLVVIIAVLLTKFSWRKIFILLSIPVFMALAAEILTSLFGDDGKITLARLVELITAENYATEEDLGRFTAVPTIAQKIFDNWYEQLVGYGLGNCDTSAFEICNTPFYKTHEYLHYSWFSSAFLFLETGYIGLCLNLLFFVIVLIQSVRMFRKKGREFVI